MRERQLWSASLLAIAHGWNGCRPWHLSHHGHGHRLRQQQRVCVLNYTVTPPPGGCTTNPCPLTLAAVLNTGTTNGTGGVLPTGAPEQIWVNMDAPGGPTPMVVAD